MQQRWLITGSSRGLGRALSEAVLEAGHRLVATARDSARLSDLVDRFGDAVRTAALDVADPIAAEAAVGTRHRQLRWSRCCRKQRRLRNVNSIEETELSDFRRQIETNLFGTIIVTKAAIPIMRQQRAGHIIQFSSVGAASERQVVRHIPPQNGAWKASRKCSRKKCRSSASKSQSSSPEAFGPTSLDHRRCFMQDGPRTDAGDGLVDVPMERPQGAYLVKT